MKLTAENLLIEPALSGGSIVRFETMDIEYSPELMHKYDSKKMSVDIKEQKGKRSLDANAYCWVLCDRISSVKGLSAKKADVYKQAVRDYGVCENLLITNEGVSKFVSGWNDPGRYGKFCDVMGKSRQHPDHTWVRAYYGSSDYNSKEMAVLIDGLVSDAKELGIETMTPDQIAEMKSLWG